MAKLEDRKVDVHIHLTVQQLRLLDSLAKKTGKRVAQLVRHAVDLMVMEKTASASIEIREEKQ